MRTSLPDQSIGVLLEILKMDVNSNLGVVNANKNQVVGDGVPDVPFWAVGAQPTLVTQANLAPTKSKLFIA